MAEEDRKIEVSNNDQFVIQSKYDTPNIQAPRATTTFERFSGLEETDTTNRYGAKIAITGEGQGRVSVLQNSIKNYASTYNASSDKGIAIYQRGDQNDAAVMGGDDVTVKASQGNNYFFNSGNNTSYQIYSSTSGKGDAIIKDEGMSANYNITGDATVEITGYSRDINFQGRGGAQVVKIAEGARGGSVDLGTADDDKLSTMDLTRGGGDSIYFPSREIFKQNASITPDGVISYNGMSIKGADQITFADEHQRNLKEKRYDHESLPINEARKLLSGVSGSVTNDGTDLGNGTLPRVNGTVPEQDKGASR